MNTNKVIEETLAEYNIDGEAMTIKVISDNHPDLHLAAKLWYEVYIEEMGYALQDGVNHEEKTFYSHKNGSLVFMALANGKCFATLRATHNKIAPLEFDYKEYSANQKLYEITKLITHKKFRKTTLTKIIIVQTQFYGRKNYEYDGIVINTTEKLSPYYERMGFKKITEEKIIHPIIRNESYLMYSTFKDFNKKADLLNWSIKLTNFKKLIKL